MSLLRTALVAVLAAAAPGIGLAQTPGAGSPARGGAGASNAVIPSQSPAAHDPGINPSAAGIQAGDIGSAGVRESTKGGRDHSGSKNLTANDHPYAAAKANHDLRWRQRTQRILRRATGSSGAAGQNGQNGAGR